MSSKDSLYLDLENKGVHVNMSTGNYDHNLTAKKLQFHPPNRKIVLDMIKIELKTVEKKIAL